MSSTGIEDPPMDGRPVCALSVTCGYTEMFWGIVFSSRGVRRLAPGVMLVTVGYRLCQLT